MEVILEQIEIPFVDFILQMHREILKVIFNRVRALGAVAFAFVETGDFGQINFIGCFDSVQNVLHAVVEFLGPENFVVAPAVDVERADMAGHGRPVNVRIHRATVFDGVACEQQEPAEGFDLVELKSVFGRSDLDAVFLDQQRNKVAKVPFAIALNAADFVKEQRQDAGVRVRTQVNA